MAEPCGWRPGCARAPRASSRRPSPRAGAGSRRAPGAGAPSARAPGAGRAVGPRLDEAEGATDLADLEALVLAADEQLEFCGRGALAHRDSTSNPVASRPQRVASATWWVERLSRSMKTWTIA